MINVEPMTKSAVTAVGKELIHQVRHILSSGTLDSILVPTLSLDEDLVYSRS